MSHNTGPTPECRWFSLISFAKPEIIDRKIRKEKDPPGLEEMLQLTDDPFSVRFMHVTDNMQCKSRIKRVIPERGEAGICNHNVSARGTRDYPPA